MHFCHLVFPLGTVCLDLGGLCPFWGVVHLYYVRSFALRCLYIFICIYICCWLRWHLTWGRFLWLTLLFLYLT